MNDGLRFCYSYILLRPMLLDSSLLRKGGQELLKKFQIKLRTTSIKSSLISLRQQLGKREATQSDILYGTSRFQYLNSFEIEDPRIPPTMAAQLQEITWSRSVMELKIKFYVYLNSERNKTKP
ncbi:Uncharacterized protein BN1224_CV14_A_00310 [Chlamydia pneumoniae]|uniref:Uncharacterized protein n=1 Tax=Chlamydia pneumoniae TaxID=83558 RepID=A0A0F7WD86_CHLPN|nr:hypothetical protein CPn_0029 [Chlamydia pneumoniae CWL029]CRI32525.1 Uncharacterized protein BN1224_Wien1_A_00320 [Chlamydia pneumoniae]CRI36512.1 Uncharacterized protein BN1224_CV14_A_00310 [Chlamydia pneumoniae]CRI37636.1 Uncharacterized protein BN1224_CV15_A_00320 [Chlamydia pneumoniae]CRI38769.1 Uncharacterized protein BN1224_CWL011_A_00330 [Chlamydia pneumoniae]